MNTDDTQKKTASEEDTTVSEELDDVTFEASPDLEAGDDPMEEGAAGEAAIKRLRERAKKSEAERTEYLAGWQRAKADLVNAAKRHDEERRKFVSAGQDEVIESILPALDSFDMAMANKEAWEKIDANWRMGVEFIRTQLLGALAQFDVTQVDPLNEKFDPTKHHSIETVPADSPEKDDVIVSVVQKGYARGGTLIRPATVKVAHHQ